MSIFLKASVPAALRSYAKSCLMAHVEPEPYDAWHVSTDKFQLTEPVKFGALFSTEKILLKCVQGPKWIVSEKVVEVRCVIPQGTRIVAPRVVIKAEQLYPWECYASSVSCWTPPPTNLLLRSESTNWLQLGYYDLPDSFEAQLGEVNFLDQPRTELPSGGLLTAEKVGYSIWHLIALGLFDGDSLDEFMRQIEDVPMEEMVNDLKEHMSKMQVHYVTELYRYDISGMGIEEFLAVTAYRTPFELCTLFQTPFLGYYDYEGPIHPLLEKFAKQTQDRIDQMQS